MGQLLNFNTSFKFDHGIIFRMKVDFTANVFRSLTLRIVNSKGEKTWSLLFDRNQINSDAICYRALKDLPWKSRI